jgi:hypothetical protein
LYDFIVDDYFAVLIWRINMKDKFTIDFNSLDNTLAQEKSYKLSDVQNRIEKVAYDLVRFRDNADTEQLWRIEERPDGPVIVALYGNDGSLMAESVKETEWNAIPDKTAMHIFYKGEPIVALSSKELGIPVEEFPLVKSWLPKKLSSDESLQKALFNKMSIACRNSVINRFPELTKVAQSSEAITLEEEIKPELQASNPHSELGMFIFAQQVKQMFPNVDQLIYILKQPTADISSLPPQLKAIVENIRGIYKDSQQIQNFIYALYMNPNDYEDVKRRQEKADAEVKSDKRRQEQTEAAFKWMKL